MMTQHATLKSTKLLKKVNYGKSGSREIQIRSSIWKKKKARKVVYQTKCKAERKRFRNVMQ